MKEVVITIESPPDVSIRVVRKEAPSRLRVSPRGRIGKPVTAFRTAFTASSLDGGATAPADALRDAFECLYQTSGKNPREAAEKAWRRALALVDGDFEVIRLDGTEVFRRLAEPQAPRPQTPTNTEKSTSIVRSISATRGVHAPRAGRHD